MRVLVTQGQLRCLISLAYQSLAPMSLLVTQNRFLSPVFASTGGGPGATPELAAHSPAPGNSLDSRFCPTNGVDSLPCSLYDSPASNSTFGALDCAGPDGIIPYSAGTCAYVAFSSLTSTDRGSMMPELSAEKDRNCRKRSEEGRREEGF